MIRGLIAVVCLVLCFCATAVYAQVEDFSTPGPLAVHLGVFMPSDKGTRDLTGPNWFDAGLSYRLLDSYDSEIRLDADYINMTAKTITNADSTKTSTKGFVIPLLLTLKTKGTSSTPLYYGIGGGAYYTRWEPSGVKATTTTKFGGHAVVGYEIDENFRAEVRYLYSQEKAVRGLAFYLNASF